MGTSAGCVGGYPGIVDMSGNLGEWENACAPQGFGNPDACGVRGGSYNDQSSTLTCTSPCDTGANIAIFVGWLSLLLLA